MVQVDVFWSYGIGAGLALAASRQLVAARQRDEDPLAGPHFSRVLLFLAAVFAPSGAYLLWAFPSWETMHVGTRDMPAWLPCVFALTNVTQGVAGYLVARWLILRGRAHQAYLHWIGGYFAMFFILVHGWDGSGYRRFFAVDHDAFLTWEPARVLEWLGSDVALALGVMGIAFIPTLLYLTATWIRDGDPSPAGRSRSGIAAMSLVAIFGAGLAPAIGASVLIRFTGWVPGTLLFAVAAWALLVRRASPGGWLYGRLVGAAGAR